MPASAADSIILKINNLIIRCLPTEAEKYVTTF